MNKRRKIGILIFLCCFIIFSKDLDAKLKDTYYVSENGHTTPLHSNYNWVKTNSGYLSASEQKNKSDLISCDSNDVQYYWTYSESTCHVNISKGINCSGTTTHTAKGKSASVAETQCKNQLLSRIRGSLSCTNSNGMPITLRVSSKDITATSTTPPGVWSKSMPSVSSIWTNTGIKKEMCKWGGTKEIGTKTLVQNVYDAEGAPAYCLNPGKSFKAQEYELVKNFDVSDCKKSNDSYYCGLAAIVAKSEKEYGADYLTTVTALRFWASYRGQDDDAWWDSQTNTVYKNSGIYKITANYIMNSNYSGATSAPSQLGVIYAEGASLSQLQNAISLFRDAVNGNIEFWVPKTEVLEAVYEKELGFVSVLLASNFDNTTRIDNITTDPSFSGITYVPESCPANEIGDYCLRITIPATLEQVKDVQEIRGIIEYFHPDDVVSKIGYYLAVDNPVKYQNMFIFDKGIPSTAEFIIKITAPICKFENGKWYDREGNETDRQGYLDSCECVEVDGVKYIKYPDRPAQSEEEWYEECEKEKCPDKGIDYSDMPEDCEKDGSDGSIKDPEICNIINREDANYKTEYGNQFCTIYCRETLDFTFMDKETAIAGRYFKHDVASKYSTLAYLSTVILSSRQCTSLIDYDNWKSQYEAANDSVLSTWNNLKKWEAFYNLNGGNYTDDYEGGADSGCNGCNWPNIDDYVISWEHANYCVTGVNGSVNCLYDQTYSETGDAAECPRWKCTSCCNPGPHSTCTSSYSCLGSNHPASQDNYDSVKQKYSSAVTQYTGALNRRDTLLYQLQDCNFMSDESKDDKTLKKMYPKGTFYVSTAYGNYTSPVELRTYNEVINYEPGNTVDIDYDENSKFNEGFDISTANEMTPNVVTQMGFSDQGKWEDYCFGCEDELRSLSGSSFTEILDYWLCSGSETGARCDKNKLTLPSNKLVNIIIERESLHYQENAFYTQVYTGHVSTSGNSQGYWIPLIDDIADYHLYPVGIKRPTGSYGIQVEFTNLGNQERVVKFEDGEFKCAYQVINDLAVYDCDDNYHVCYPCTGDNCYPGDDPRNPYDLGVYFRTIDLTDVFPNSAYSPTYNNRPHSVRPIGKNWTINNAKEIVEQIQKLNTEIWQVKPQYEITLNSQTIAEIKKRNKRTNYLNYSLTCDGLSCTSDFLSKDLKEILMEKYDTLYKKDTTIKQNTLYNYNR